MRQKPDLIVPIRDRRQRKRYLTLKNFGYASIAATVLFIGITIRSEMRGAGPSNYGRLVERELPPRVEQKPVEVINEAPVTKEETHANPFLTEAAAREQWLRAQADPLPVAMPPRIAAAVATGETDVAIVGGPEGVKVVQRERRRPVLGGGFGR